MYKDFVFENIAVSHDKEIFILDYEELSIIENFDFDEASGLYGFNIIFFCFSADMKSCLFTYLVYSF